MRNLFLFATLITLFVFTYFYQELGNQIKREKIENKTTLISTAEMGELVSIKGPYFELVRDSKGNFHFADSTIQNYKIDITKLEKFFEALATLRVERELTADDKEGIKIDYFVPRDGSAIRFNFKNDYLVFQLGNKIETDQTFYVSLSTKKKERLLIVKDVSPLIGTYLKEDFHRNDEKYRKIASLFVLTDEFFWDMKLLDSKLADWTDIEILNVRKKKFELDVINRTTNPSALSSLSYNQNFYSEFLKSLVHLNSKRITNYNTSQELEDFVSQITIKKMDGNATYLSLYQKFKGEQGYFAVIDDVNKVYDLDIKTAKIFFSNVQEFWIKQPYDLANIKNVSITQKESTYHFKREIGDKIHYLVSNEAGVQGNHRQLERLFDYFNQEADRVSLYDKFDKELYPEEIFSFSLGTKNFKLFRAEVEILLVDIQNELKYHFYTGQEVPFSIYLKDYILRVSE